MNRRSFLTHAGSAAGAMLLAPLFRSAWANGPAPCRFVFVVEGNAIEPMTLMSTATRTAIQSAATASLDGRRWASRLYGHASALTQSGDLGTAPALGALLPGSTGIDLSTRSAVVLGLSSLVTGGGHSSGFGALSCTRSTAARPGGETIDAWLARTLYANQPAPYDALRLGVEGSSSRLGNRTCATAPGRSAPVTLDPRLAFDNLFGFLPGSSGARRFRDRSDLLDFALLDVNAALSAFAGNSAERAKLEQYQSSIEVVRQRQTDLEALAADISAGLAFDSPEDPSTNPLYAGDPSHLSKLEAQFENVTAALIGGLTNVAVITSGTGEAGFSSMTYGEILTANGLDAELSRHDLHHASGGSQPHQDAIHGVTAWHVDRVAKLARALAAVPEAGGSMLDHTVIVYLSDNGEQHHSTAEEWPMLLVGGDAMGLATDGRSVVFPGEGATQNRQVSNLFNTLGYAAGQPLDDFGAEGDNRIALGPLSELMS